MNCDYNWLLGDHLGSTSMTTDASGQVISELRYSAFGEMRYQNGSMTTDYLYTGQREEAEIGLYYYVARWYDPAIGRFLQADSFVPDPGSALGYDRYSYGWNNPINFLDPTGHFPQEPPNTMPCMDGCTDGEISSGQHHPDILNMDELTTTSSVTGIGGSQMYDLYVVMYIDKSAWWCDAFGENGFSVWDFMSVTAYYEANGNPAYAEFMPEAGVRWYNEVYEQAIPGDAESTLNWWGGFSQSAADRYKNGGLISEKPEYGGSPEFVESVFSDFGGSFKNSPGDWITGYASDRPFGWGNISAYWQNKPDKSVRRTLMTNQSQALFVYVQTGTYVHNFVIPSGCAWAVGEQLWKSTVCSSINGP